MKASLSLARRCNGEYSLSPTWFFMHYGEQKALGDMDAGRALGKIRCQPYPLAWKRHTHGQSNKLRVKHIKRSISIWFSTHSSGNPHHKCTSNFHRKRVEANVYRKTIGGSYHCQHIPWPEPLSLQRTPTCPAALYLCCAVMWASGPACCLGGAGRTWACRTGSWRAWSCSQTLPARRVWQRRGCWRSLRSKSDGWLPDRIWHPERVPLDFY